MADQESAAALRDYPARGAGDRGAPGEVLRARRDRQRPLVLREIAEELELHESTISRGTTQKFMLTPRGIYEFKHFFGSGLATENGGTCSSAAYAS